LALLQAGLESLDRADDAVHITPDFQVIADPGGVSDRDVAIVGGIFLEMEL
jgi:carbohydrate-selective porin OprB